MRPEGSTLGVNRMKLAARHDSGNVIAKALATNERYVSLWKGRLAAENVPKEVLLRDAA